MIKIINPIPDPRVVKEVICKNCGVTLGYTPNDVVSSRGVDIDGSSYTYKYIRCPNCEAQVII